MSKPEPMMSNVGDSIATAAREAANLAQRLAPGPLADLRRMTVSGAPCFWRLAAQHPATIGNPTYRKQWMEIVRMIAILTPKGEPEKRPPLHAPSRRLGEVLCDGGDPDPEWKGPQPTFSERRLAQLTASRQPLRTVLLTRAARIVARSRSPDDGVNVVDLARAVLRPEDVYLLAEPYYRRLDRAERIANQTEDQ